MQLSLSKIKIQSPKIIPQALNTLHEKIIIKKKNKKNSETYSSCTYFAR